METLDTFLPHKTSSPRLCTDNHLLEASTDMSNQQKPQQDNSSEITDINNCNNCESEITASQVHDVQIFDNTIEKKCTNSLKQITSSDLESGSSRDQTNVLCTTQNSPTENYSSLGTTQLNSKEDGNVLGTAESTDIVKSTTEPNTNKNDTTQHKLESMCSDSKNLTNVTSILALGNSSDSTPSSINVSSGNSAESDSTVADCNSNSSKPLTDNLTASVASETHEINLEIKNNIVSEMTSSISELCDENEIKSISQPKTAETEIKAIFEEEASICRPNDEKYISQSKTASPDSPTNAFSEKDTPISLSNNESEIILEPQTANSEPDMTAVSEIEKSVSESCDENTIISQLKTTHSESLEESKAITKKANASSVSCEENETPSGLKDTRSTLLEENVTAGITSAHCELSEINNSTNVLSSSLLDESSNVLIPSQEMAPQITSVESAAELIWKDTGSQADSKQEDGNAENHITISEDDQAENMQCEEDETMGKIENCFTISGAELDCSVTESDAVDTDEDAELTGQDEMNATDQSTDCANLSDSSVLLLNHDGIEQAQNSLSGNEAMSDDESATVNNQDMSSQNTDGDNTCQIRITESRSVAGNCSEFIDSEVICAEESDTEQSAQGIVNNNESLSDHDEDFLSHLSPNEQSNETNNEGENNKKGTVGAISESLDNCVDRKEDQLTEVQNSDLDKTGGNKSRDKETTAAQFNELSEDNKIIVGIDKEKTSSSAECSRKGSIDDNFTSKENADSDSCKEINSAVKADSLVNAKDTYSNGEKDNTSLDEKSTNLMDDKDMNLVVKKDAIFVDKKGINSLDVKDTNLVCEKDTTSLVKKESNAKKLNDTNFVKENDPVSVDDDTKLQGEKEFNSLDKKDNLDTKVKIQNLSNDHKEEISNESYKKEPKVNSKNEVDKTKNIEEDDEVMFVGEVEEIKPDDFSNEKSNFTSRSVDEDMDSIVIDDTECLDSDTSDKETVIKSVIGEQNKQKLEKDKSFKDLVDTHSIGSGKKRAHDGGNEAKSVFKCSKTDFKDVKLDDSGKKPKEPVASEVFDSDDDDVIFEEVEPVSKAVKNETTEPKDKMIVLTSEALQNLITLRVKTFLMAHKQINLDKLNIRARGMQSASNLWRETAKHLEKSIADLATLNQKLERNKKQLENRSVGIQVGESNSFRPLVNGSYPKTPESASSNVGQNLSRSGSFNSPAQTSQPVRQQVQSSPSSNSALRSPVPTAQPPAPRIHNRPGRPVLNFSASHQTPPPPQRLPSRIALIPVVRPPVPINNVDNLIDLTDDDDSNKNTTTSYQPRTDSLKFAGKPAAPGNNMKSNSIPYSSNGQVQHSQSSGTQQNFSNRPGASSNSPYKFPNMSNTSTPGQGSAVVSNAPPPIVQGQPPSSSRKRSLPQNFSQNVSSAKTTAHSLPPSFHISNRHPAPLPTGMDAGNAPATAKKRPPKPGLKISRVSQGIVLSWNMPSLHNVEKIASYQLFAYQESDSNAPRSSLWKKVGDVKALPLPMACTLTQFQEGNKYHFAVRAVDQFGRWGSYSDPSSIYLGIKT